jgi:very-short-patch-repair endonuclease
MSLKTKIIPYNPELKSLAKDLRRNMTLSEVLLWNELRKKQMLGYDFDRQRPLGNFIVDFFCKELSLAIEIDGDTHIYRYEYDDERQKTLEKLGVHFLRFDDLEVKRNMNNVLRVIEDWINKNKPIPDKKKPTPNPSEEGNQEDGMTAKYKKPTPDPSREGNPIDENPAKFKRPTPRPSREGSPLDGMAAHYKKTTPDPSGGGEP